MIQRCIVIGGTGEVGQAICRELAARGAKVGFTYFRNEARGAELAAHTGSSRVRVDATQPKALALAIDHLAGELGGLDALVHCPARVASSEVPSFERLDDATDEGFDAMFALNVKGAFFSARRAVFHMKKSGGNIVFLGSVDGVKSVPSAVLYATSKGALSAMARSLAKECGADGVRVNVVAPGILESGASRVIPAEVRAEYLKHTCAGRFGSLAEVARVVAWLALENTYATGQSLSVDGGL